MSASKTRKRHDGSHSYRRHLRRLPRLQRSQLVGKRSDFERRERDFYPTPVKAVEPLIPHLPDRFTYVEPCAGKGDLVKALSTFEGVAHGGRFCAMCHEASDLHALGTDNAIKKRDAFDIDDVPAEVDFFITNPPWSRKILHPLIIHLSAIRPTWLLFDADWAHTRQAAPYMMFLRRIVSVGRIKWIPGSPHTGKDNCAWHLFETNYPGGAEPAPQFFGRSQHVV